MTQVQQELLTDLPQEQAETVEGGGVFTISNQSSYQADYYLSGKKKFFSHKPGQKWIWTKKGNSTIIIFDQDSRSEVTDYKRYTLTNGGVYQFRNNNTTPNPHDIELYTIS